MNDYLASALREIDRAAGHLDVATLQRPADGKWSIAEILEHLTLAFTANAAAMEKALASGTLKARPPRMKEALARVLVIDVGYFPRVGAPEMTRPRNSIPADRSLDAIRDALTRLDDTLTRAAGQFGTATPVANHPYFAGLTVPQWRKFHWRHTVHHMNQVRLRTLSR